MKLSETVALNIMSGIQFYDNYYYNYNDFRESAQLRKAFCPNFDGFAQFSARLTDRLTDGSSDWAGEMGFGMAYRPIRSVEVQTDLDFGVTDNTYETIISTKVSFRF